MKGRTMRCLVLFAGVLLFAVSSLGCGGRKSYTRHPLVAQSKVVAGPINVPETQTPAEPYAPPRPNLEVELSNLSTVPMIQSSEKTPAASPP